MLKKLGVSDAECKRIFDSTCSLGLLLFLAILNKTRNLATLIGALVTKKVIRFLQTLSSKVQQRRGS